MIDVDSFVDFYIVSELFRTEDIAFGSTRFYMQDGKLYAGPLWDLDLSSGNNGESTAADKDMKAQTNLWFGALMKSKEFQKLVSERYAEKLPQIKHIFEKPVENEISVANISNETENIYEMAALIEKSANANYTEAYNVSDANEPAVDNGNYNRGWGYNVMDHSPTVHGSENMKDTYMDYVNDFADWMEARNEYLKVQLDVSDPDETLEDTDYAGMTVNRYYNLALDKKVTALNQYNGDNAAVATDGLFGSGGNVDSELLLLAAANGGHQTYGNGETWAMVDLGAYYKASDIDKIMVLYKDNAENDTALGHPYKIQFSKNAYHWEDADTVVNVENLADFDWAGRENGVKTAKIDEIHATGTVRYIRFYYPEVPTYGIQINEIAVLDTDKNAAKLEVEVPETPEFTAEPGDEDGQIKVNITAPEGTVDEYVIYVDGEEKLRTPNAGEHILEGYKKGNHQVYVEAVYNGMYSEPSEEQTVEVEATVEWDMEGSLTDPLLNLAYTKTPSGPHKEGTMNQLTDGNISEWNNYWGVNVDGNDGYFQVDLEKNYTVESIDNVTIWYRSDVDDCTPNNNGCTGYEIQYSNDGESFQTVKTVTKEQLNPQGDRVGGWADAGRYVLSDDIDKDYAKTQINSVRYVRVVYHGNIGWGAQAREMAVYNKTATAEEYKVDVIEPLTDGQLEEENIPADAEWKQIGDTQYWYYDQENINAHDPYVQGNNIVTGYTVAGALQSAKINGVELADTYEGTNVSLDMTRISKNGVYKLVILDFYGNPHYIYYKRQPNLTATGVVVTGMTENSATITWNIPSDVKNGDYTFTVVIDGNEVKTGDTTGSYTWEEDLSDGEEHTVEIRTVDAEGNVVATSESVTFAYKGEPDLSVKVKVSVPKAEIGEKATVTATITNLGGDYVLAADRITLFEMRGGNQGDYHLLGADGDEGPLVQRDGTRVFPAGASYVFTYEVTLTEEMLTGDYKVGVKIGEERGFNGDANAENDIDEQIIPVSTLPPIENFRARLSGDGDVIVGWTKAEDEEDKNYTYEIYVDGDLQESLTTEPSEAGDRITATLQDLEDGRHQIEVRRTLDDEFSPKVHTYIIVYDASTLKWTQWDYHRTQDIDNDTWWYAKNYMDAGEILEGEAYGPRITTNGEYFQFILKKDDVALDPATEVTVRGETYAITTNEGDPAYRQGDHIYLNHELFPVPGNVRERIFPITITGTMGGKEVIKTFLVKLNNADYATAKLEYVDADGKPSEEPGGHVVFTWDDPDEHGTYGYKIHYYQYTDDYDPDNLTDPSKTVESVRWVHPSGSDSNYIKNEDGSFSYHLTENEIYLRSNTEIKVVPVINRAGDEFEEEVGMATAQAELTFYGDPTAETGAYVSPTEKSKLLFKVINIGTAAVAVKAKQDAHGGNTNLLQIKVSEYTDASRTELVDTSGDHANPNTFNHNLDEDDVLPGEIITAEHEHLFKTRDTYYFTAEIDPNNYIYELDADENNVHDYDIRAAYKGHLEIQQKEGGGYKAIFAPDQSLWAGGAEPGVTQQSPTDFEISYYDHGELKTCRIKNTGSLPQVSKPEWGEHVFELDLPDIEHIDSDMPVTIAAVYDDGSTAVFADDTPFWQEREMDWTPITSTDDGSGEPYDFTVANTTVNIEYKILDTSITDLHFKDIMTVKHGYAPTWLNMGISTQHADILQNSYETGMVDGYGERTYSTTTFSFAQAKAEYCNDYGNPLNPEPALEIKPVRSADVMAPDGTFLPTEASSWEYVGNGFNMNLEAFGLGKYYVAKIDTKDGQFITIAWRVTTEEGEWYRVSGEGQDEMPFYYHDENHIYNTAKYYYDVRDWYLSSVSCFGGGNLTIQTDPAKSLNGYNPETDVLRPDVEPGEHWHIDVAKASLGSDGRVVEPEDGYITYQGGEGPAGRQGDGRLLVAMEPIMKELIGHSDDAGIQNFYYLIRVYYDDVNHKGDYIAVPLLVRADIPEITALPKENIRVTSDSDSLNVSFKQVDKAAGSYYYDVYYGDELAASVTDAHSTNENIRVELPVPEGEKEHLDEPGYEFKIKIVSKWCYNSTETDANHWYDDGSGAATNHYQSTETTYTYLNEIETGDVSVQGFQINTNKEAGGISEYMPSMRVVSRAGTTLLGLDGRRHGVVSYGTLIAYEKEGSLLTKDDMVQDSDSQYVTDVPATSHLEKWGAESDEDYHYYAVNLKQINYNYNKLKADYYYRAYAVLDDDSVVYSDNIYKVNTYEIAENLYENKKMYTKEGHDFLYNDILNIVSMKENAADIGHAMTTTLNVANDEDDKYDTINKAYKDVIYYALTGKGYTYQNRGATFTSKNLGEEKEAELLGWLKEKTGSEETTLHEWIEKHVDTIDQKDAPGTKYKGFYKKVDYQWDSNLYKNYEKQSSSE